LILRGRKRASYLYAYSGDAKVKRLGREDPMKNILGSGDLKGEEIINNVFLLLEKHEKMQNFCINLDAGVGLMSMEAIRAASSVLLTYGVDAYLGSRSHKGYKYYDEIEGILIKLIQRLFKVKFVDFTPQTGSIANGVVLGAFTKPGDTIMALPVPRGHPSYRESGYSGYRSLNVVDIPFDFLKMNIRLDQAYEKAKIAKPKIIIVGSSLMLFPYQLTELVDIASEIKARFVYDGSHVLGLVPWNRFQNPLAERCDIVTGGTYKTLCGPQRGLILFNNKDFVQNIRTATKGLIANYAPFNIPSLAVAIIENLEFGKYFSENLIKNARSLAISLSKMGFKIVGEHEGFTKSNMIAIDVGNSREKLRDDPINKLEKANIIGSQVMLYDTSDFFDGIRLGVTTVTRRGMGSNEMHEISKFIKRVLIDNENEKKIGKEVTEFMKKYQKVHYSFENSERIEEKGDYL
jgi:glycine hydroxymethyltransferase